MKRASFLVRATSQIVESFVQKARIGLEKKKTNLKLSGVVFFFFNFNILFIWLCPVSVVALGIFDLHYGIQDPFYFLHAGSSSLDPLHWEHRFLATGSPEKSLKFSFEYAKIWNG